jgi:D-3-phosphoglycerate dehydrogenase
MKSEKVLITDDVHPVMLQGLEAAGYTCEYRPEITLQQVRKIVNDYVGLIINSKIKADQTMLESTDQLRFIGRLGSGLDIIDLEVATQKGISVLSVPEANCNAVGEHALGMLLSLANNLVRADREVRQKIWKREENRGFELEGKNIGIIGFGHTGNAFAEKLQGFRVNVLAYDKYKSGFAKNLPHVKEVTLEELLIVSDIISFHVQLTEETLFYFDETFINSCKNGVIIINTSRGKVVKTDVLVRGLNEGKIGGACLDVFENEKPGTYSDAEDLLYGELYGMENVVLSPHVAGWTVESKEKIASYLLKKVLSVEGRG